LAKAEYNRIKLALVGAKKTNRELADYLNINPQTVSRWCTNDSQPNVATLFEIAKFLKVKVSFLLNEQEQA
jgi:transcriptional regulator with XRE-family HTH domain